MTLGKHQLCLLASMASPFNLLIVKDKIAMSLVRRGLLEPRDFPKRDDDDAFFGITPAGLRAVADALQSGQLEQFYNPKFQRDRVRLYVNAKGKTTNA